MLRDITLGQYVPGTSFVHLLDPRTKLLLTLLVVAALFFVSGFTGLLGFGLLILLTIVVSRLPIGYVLRGLRPLVVIIVFTFALNALFTPGEPSYNLLWLKISRPGLIRGAFMMVRLVLLVVSSTVLTLTTSPVSLTDGIESLLTPAKRIGVPAHEFAMMMTIALRFIPTLVEEADKIMKAQMARGADFESGNLVNRARNFVPLLVPLFVGAFRRADDLAVAMEARCYRGGKGRTRMRRISFDWRDAVAFGLVVPAVALLVVLF